MSAKPNPPSLRLLWMVFWICLLTAIFVSSVKGQCVGHFTPGPLVGSKSTIVQGGFGWSVDLRSPAVPRTSYRPATPATRITPPTTYSRPSGGHVGRHVIKNPFIVEQQ